MSLLKLLTTNSDYNKGAQDIANLVVKELRKIKAGIEHDNFTRENIDDLIAKLI